MSNLSKNSDSNPFDVIRHEDAQSEYWLARELMPILGYTRWERVPEVIDRAKTACSNSGNVVSEHFSEETRKTKGRKAQDFKLSRYGCYLVAMNGDPRKPEIAAAQNYFAVKTREAETVIPAQAAELEKLRLELALSQSRVREMEAQKAYQESSYWISKTEGLAMLQYYRGGEMPVLAPAPKPEKVFVNDRGEVVGSSKSKCSVTQLMKAAGYNDKEAKSTNLHKVIKGVLAQIGIDFDSGKGLETAAYLRQHKVCPESRKQEAIAAIVRYKAQNPSIWSAGLSLDLDI